MRRLFLSLTVLLPLNAFALNITSLPSGMCPLDVSKPAERSMFEALQGAIQGGNHLVVAFANCDELSALAQNKRDNLMHYGTILEQKTQLDMDRAAYLTMATKMINTNPNLMAQGMAQASAAADQALADGSMEGKGTVQAAAQGVIFQNENVVLLSVLQSHEVGGKRIQVASVAGITLVGKSPVTINLYAPAADPNVASREGDLIVTFAPKLIAANP